MWTVKLSLTAALGAPVALISIPELSIATCPCGCHRSRKTAEGSAAIVRWTSIRSFVTFSSCHQAGRDPAEVDVTWMTPLILTTSDQNTVEVREMLAAAVSAEEIAGFRCSGLKWPLLVQGGEEGGDVAGEEFRFLGGGRGPPAGRPR